GYQMVNLERRPQMSDQQGEQSGRELGSLDAGSTAPTSSGATDDPAANSMLEPAMAGSGLIAPDHEAPKEDPPATAVSKAESPGSATPKTEPAARADAPRRTGQLVVLSPGERARHSGAAESRPSSRRRLAAMAAVAALALLGGAVGGALATAGLTHDADQAVAVPADRALQASVSRTDADIAALKAALARTKQLGLSRFNETKDRLDKIEKAETEPAAKLASLSAAVEELRAQPAAPARVAAVTAASDVTGSITTPQGAAALPKPAISPQAAKADIRRPPVVHDWVLRDVSHGGALIQGRRGFYEVYAGDPLPGLGRVAAIRRLDGRWAVVTVKGLIVAR
ncbi:MAG: hypothetical protein ACREDL_24920, partial [Bradyrhizobium sp.]